MTDITAAAAHLWTVLRTYLRQACALFGEPSALARNPWLTRQQHQDACAWLRPLEALARRLLFLKAREAPPQPAPAAPEQKSRKRAEMSAGFGAYFDVEQSETWRVRFDVGLKRRRLRRQCASNDTPPTCDQTAGEGADTPQEELVSATSLALRLEALIRVCENPEPYAKALARKLVDNDNAADAFVIVHGDDNGPLHAPVREAAHLCWRVTLNDPAPAFADSS